MSLLWNAGIASSDCMEGMGGREGGGWISIKPETQSQRNAVEVDGCPTPCVIGSGQYGPLPLLRAYRWAVSWGVFTDELSSVCLLSVSRMAAGVLRNYTTVVIHVRRMPGER